MREPIIPRPAERETKSRRSYVAPSFESETVFETMALRCGKSESGDDGGGDGGGDRLPMRRRRGGCKSYYTRKNS